MDLLFILLGAALAVGGGLLGQRQEQVLRRQREDEEVLIQINDALLDLHGLLSLTGSHANTTPTTTQAQMAVQKQGELLQSTDALAKLALRLRSPQHRQVAVRVTKIALDAPFRTADNLHQIIRTVQFLVNAGMIEQYERDERDRPTVF